MNITVLRDRTTDAGTPGTLLVAEIDWSCRTLELPWRNNERGISCIMPDVYRATTWHSPTMGRDVLRLEDKHGRQDCLIHTGNWAGDASKGLYTQVHGCTLVGTLYGSSAPEGKPEQFAILHSVAALTSLLAAIGAGPHQVTYAWAAGCAPEDLSDHLA